MKRFSVLLLFLNLAWAGIVAFLLLAHHPENLPPQASSNDPIVIPVAQLVSITAEEQESPIVNHFHWSQIEATDYPSYISNLRSIGCPEQTLRDIIHADIDATIYAPRRKQLQRKYEAVTRPNAQRNYETDLQQLNAEENAMIATLLGTSIASAPSPEEISPISRSLRIQPEERAVLVPLVLKNVDLRALNFNDQQTALVENVRKNFVQEIGGPNQDPMDPAYHERWQKAQASADNKLQAMLGLRSFQMFEMAARTSRSN